MPDKPERARLATRLRDLRAATGLSGNRFAAERVRWPQSRVSRVETGTQLPTEDDIRAWVAAAGAGSEVVAELLELLEQAREAALHNSVGTIGTLLGQLDRLLTMTALPSVDVGIVPFTVSMLPVPGFVLYDDDVVTAESLTAEQRLIEPDEVAQYVNFFDHLDAVAATGPDAAVLIQQVAAELRGRRNIGR